VAGWRLRYVGHHATEHDGDLWLWGLPIINSHSYSYCDPDSHLDCDCDCHGDAAFSNPNPNIFFDCDCHGNPFDNSTTYSNNNT
jgi:hypothetical protein